MPTMLDVGKLMVFQVQNEDKVKKKNAVYVRKGISMRMNPREIGNPKTKLFPHSSNADAQRGPNLEILLRGLHTLHHHA